MSDHGANKVVPTCSVMGPVQAALESSCRWLAYAPGGPGIRVHAISPMGEPVDIMELGFTCACLATPYARRLSGETLYLDGCVNIMAGWPFGRGRPASRQLRH